MTIPEAAQLVLGAGGMARGGEVYVLDMGESVRILDLARDLIKMAGLKLERDIQIVYSGIRPGEKLDEELFYTQEHFRRTSCQRIFCARDEGALELESIERLVLDLLERARMAETAAERQEMRELLLRVSCQPGRYLAPSPAGPAGGDEPRAAGASHSPFSSLDVRPRSRGRRTSLGGADA
jgi:FlaA1/EpsC-like NDP-sugar epimerase